MVAQFSSDFRYIQRGAILKFPRKIDNSIDKHQYPMDGKWRIKCQYRRDHTSRHDDDDLVPSAEITVIFNKFQYGGIAYSLCLGNNDETEENYSSVYFIWPFNNVRQVVESGIDLRRCPEGPDIGSFIVWTVNDPRYHRIIWVRTFYISFIE